MMAIKIAIVNDEEGILDTIEKYLQRAGGYEVHILWSR